MDLPSNPKKPAQNAPQKSRKIPQNARKNPQTPANPENMVFPVFGELNIAYFFDKLQNLVENQSQNAYQWIPIKTGGQLCAKRSSIAIV